MISPTHPQPTIPPTPPTPPTPRRRDEPGCVKHVYPQSPAVMTRPSNLCTCHLNTRCRSQRLQHFPPDQNDFSRLPRSGSFRREREIVHQTTIAISPWTAGGHERWTMTGLYSHISAANTSSAFLFTLAFLFNSLFIYWSTSCDADSW